MKPDWFDAVFEGRRRWLLLTAASLLAFFTLSPILQGGFYADDAKKSLLSARYFALVGGSVLRSMIDSQASWIVGQGRFFPLSGYVDLVFYAVNGNALIYKLFILALVIVDLLLFRVLVVKLTRSQAMGLLALLLPPLIFQVRYADDALTTYQGLLQIVLLYTLLSLIALVAHIDTGKRRYLVASLVAYAASLLTYEVGIPFFLVFWLVAYLYPRRRRFADATRTTWPFAALAVLAGLGAIAIRARYGIPVTASAGGSPYALNLDPLAVAGTLAKQTTAALPLTYYAMYLYRAAVGAWSSPPLPGFVGTIVAQPLTSVALAVGYGSLIWIACVRAARERVSGDRSIWPLLASVGGGLLVLPGTLLALSPKYQQATWVSWGVGYLPVYISCFGVALLAVAGLQPLLASSLPRVRRTVTGVAIALAAFLGVLAYGDTGSVIQGWASIYDHPRAIEIAALERGIMAPLADGAALLTRGSDWETPTLFKLYAGKNVGPLGSLGAPGDDVLERASDSTPSTAGIRYTFGPGADLRALDFQGVTDHDGYATFGTVASLTVDSQGAVSDAKVEPSRVYLSWSERAAAASGATRYDSLASLGLDKSSWVRKGSGPGWALYERRSLVPSAAP